MSDGHLITTLIVTVAILAAGWWTTYLQYRALAALHAVVVHEGLLTQATMADETAKTLAALRAARSDPS